MANQLKYLFGRSKRAARGLLAKNSWERKALQLRYQYPEELELDSKGLLLKETGLCIPLNRFEFILDGYNHLRSLSARLSPKLYFQDGVFIIDVGNVKLSVATAEEILIIVEIFLIGSYSFFTDKQLVVIDVGMNVGFASLSFASKNEVIKVYGFEPFERTYNRALDNFEYNATLALKIASFKFGLSDKDEVIEVDYDFENKGQVGIHGTSLIRSKVREAGKVTMQLKKASTEIRKVFDIHPGNHFAIKIDCEGAEYQILRDLFEDGLLSRFNVVLIEWHEKGPDELVDILSKSRFSIFCQQSSEKMVGMIYAIR